MKIAVVGAGISGLSAAWLLGGKHDVVLFEASTRLGGHAHTVDVRTPEGLCPLDTGFIVYNSACYPNLIAWLGHLGVETAPTEMSFSVSLDRGAYEYSGSGLTGLFGQASNALSPAHWRMVGEILRFFREASATDVSLTTADLTLGRWLDGRSYSQMFIHAHILPMAAAIWSAPADEMLEFPFAAFVRFFANHGLLQVSGRPEWRTVKGGSRVYVDAARAVFPGRISLGDPVVDVAGSPSRVTITTRLGARDEFDAAIVACHADDALSLVETAGPNARHVLGAFRYERNEAVLHTDKSFMPSRRRLWSSWNYLGKRRHIDEQGTDEMSVTYWMNRLQALPTATDYFVSLNPFATIPEDKIAGRFAYRHPIFDTAALKAQSQLPGLQGCDRVWYAGSYFGYGFHEDGLQSGLAAAEDLSLRLNGGNGAVRRPWPWDANKSRIAMPAGASDARCRMMV